MTNGENGEGGRKPQNDVISLSPKVKEEIDRVTAKAIYSKIPALTGSLMLVTGVIGAFMGWHLRAKAGLDSKEAQLDSKQDALDQQSYTVSRAEEVREEIKELLGTYKDDFEYVRTTARKAASESDRALGKAYATLESADSALAVADRIAQKGEEAERLVREIEGSVTNIVDELVGYPGFKRDVIDATKKEVADGILPIGSVAAWPSSAPVPRGWAPCEGGELSAADYQELDNVLGSTYEATPDPDRVGLPDFRGVFLRGLDQRPYARGGLDPDQRAFGTLQQGAITEHHHSFGYTDKFANVSAPGRTNRVSEGGSYTVVHESRSNTTSLQGDEETRPVNCVVKWIIRVK